MLIKHDVPGELHAKELQTWLTNEIRKFEGCEECSFGGVLPLRQPDEFGCDWFSGIITRVTGVPPKFTGLLSKV